VNKQARFYTHELLRKSFFNTHVFIDRYNLCNSECGKIEKIKIFPETKPVDFVLILSIHIHMYKKLHTKAK